VSYQVLARKYRPQTFEDVVGQTPIVTTLRNAVEQNRVHHAYLFSGLRGIGKTTVARLFAKALNCEKGPTSKPCNACPSCREIAGSRSLDVLEIDGASNRGIDAVRELRETVRYAPSRDRYKVYIIDEVHMLTSEAWNALLKTLEEPPAHVVFLFATTEYRKIPLTILSRCQHFEFKKIPHEPMLKHLRLVAEGEQVEVPPGVLELIARMSEGSLRDAQSGLDQVIAFSGARVDEEQARTILGVIDRELISGFFDAVLARDCERLVRIVETVFEKGYQPVHFLEDLMAHGRDLLLARVLRDPSGQIAGSAAEIRALVERAQAYSEDDLLRLVELLAREEPRLKSTAHPRFLLEALAIKLARLSDLRPIEEILARLGSAPPEPSPGGPAAGPARPVTGAPARAPAPDPHPPAGASPGHPGSPARDTSLVEAILRRVHEERAALGGFLGQASWVEIADGSLQIAFLDKHGFFREKVESRESIDYLRKVAREVAGRDLPIRVTVAAPGVAETVAAPAPAAPGLSGGSPGTDPGQKQRLKEEALKQPMVKSLLDALGGEIVDVESA
jgi:DNA polymerase III subunit gamma/tau